MKYLVWRFRLMVLSVCVGYAADRWRLLSHWSYCMQYDAWRGFFEDGYSPRDALNEDAIA